jgi:deuterolysin
MVFSTRTLAAFALGLSALSFSTPTRRAPSLSVAVSGTYLIQQAKSCRLISTTAPNAVDSVADAKITVAVTNTGSESVKVLKYGTALDAEHATKSFVVTRNGKEAAFSGIKMQVNPTIADDSAFVVIPAGETVTAVHDGWCVFMSYM